MLHTTWHRATLFPTFAVKQNSLSSYNIQERKKNHRIKLAAIGSGRLIKLKFYQNKFLFKNDCVTCSVGKRWIHYYLYNFVSINLMLWTSISVEISLLVVGFFFIRACYNYMSGIKRRLNESNFCVCRQIINCACQKLVTQKLRADCKCPIA